MTKSSGSALDHTASDVLTPDFWVGRAERPAPGIDIACTKIAIDLQGLNPESRDETLLSSVAILRDALDADVVFIALLDAAGERFEHVHAAVGQFSQCRPQAMRGMALASLPLLQTRNEHVRLTEFRDTAAPRRDQNTDAARFSAMAIGSVLCVSVRARGRYLGFMALGYGLPRGPFDVNLQLLMKLLGASLGSGLERLENGQVVRLMQGRTALAEIATNEGMWDVDVENGTTYFSPRWRNMLGYEEDALKDGLDWRALVHPEDLARVQSLMRDHVAGTTALFESEHRMRHRNGDWRWVLGRAKAQLDAHGRLVRLVGVELDITERKLFEEALFREKESAQVTLQSIGDGVITTDARSHVVYMNPIAAHLVGWKMEDAFGKPIDSIFRAFHEETCEPLNNPLTESITRQRPIKSVRPMLLIRRDGNELYVESTAAPIRHGSGEIGGGVLVFHDVSESRELNRRLSHHASHDSLTGLVNRREFETRLERALRGAKGREAGYAVCHIDVDQFKLVNDSSGHSAGDALLGQLGALLKSKVRFRDTLARLGGDEFGLLLEACPLDEAMRTAEALCETVRSHRFQHEDRVFRLAVSIGVVPVTADNAEVAGVLSAADSACAAAKEAGRNRVHSFAENDIELMRRRREMQWAARINAALEDNRFELYRMQIQPLQRQEEGAHYELLLRMRDETGKIIPPDNFISAAERYGIIPSVDRWVIETAFRWLVSEADERERLAMCSINLSGQSLGDDKFLPFVIEQFQRSGLDGSKICFEITETAAVASFSQANRFIQSLKELGCRFALDDFGAGMSSFGYLKHFPVDFLKIDGSFVREMLHDPIDREMVRTINEIGHLTGKQTIAEFAENDEIIAMLTSMGVDYAQGYGIAQPQRIVRGIASAPQLDSRS